MPRSTTKSLIHDEAILRQLRLGASWAAVPATVRPLSSWPPPTGGAPREPIALASFVIAYLTIVEVVKRWIYRRKPPADALRAANP